MIFRGAPRVRRSFAILTVFGVTLGCLLAGPAFSDVSCKNHSHTRAAPTAGASKSQPSSDARARPSVILSANGRLSVSPVILGENTALSVISPEPWDGLRATVSKSLQDTHRRLHALLGQLPPIATSVRLMTTDTFTESTGAPEWTNALYYRGQILIPINPSEPVDTPALSRAVAHEYTHAVINALSNGRAPGWLDEGFAQWVEGEENPILKPALYEWLTDNAPLPLNKLQGGFTRFASEIVPAAYAQSLLSTTIVLNTYGFPGFRAYLDVLSAGGSNEEAMIVAFESTPDQFEERLGSTLRRWHNQQHELLVTARGKKARSTLTQISRALSDSKLDSNARANW